MKLTKELENTDFEYHYIKVYSKKRVDFTTLSTPIVKKLNNSKDGDKVVEALRVVEGDEIIMTTMQGQMVRIETDPIRPIGRASQGVKILSLKKAGDFIISVSRVMKVEGAEDEESEETRDLSRKDRLRKCIKFDQIYRDLMVSEKSGGNLRFIFKSCHDKRRHSASNPEDYRSEWMIEQLQNI